MNDNGNKIFTGATIMFVVFPLRISSEGVLVALCDKERAEHPWR